MLIYFALLGLVSGYIFTLSGKEVVLGIETFGVIRSTIFTGTISVLEGSDVHVQIISNDEKNKYLDLDITKENRVNFSFNIDSATSATMGRTVLLKMLSPDARVELDYRAQADTFKKEVAVEMVLEPAYKALQSFKKVLSVMIDQSADIAQNVSGVIAAFMKITNVMLILSLMTLASISFMVIFQLRSIKKFLKEKKFI